MHLTMLRHERSLKPRSFSQVHDMPMPRVNWHAPSGMLRREGAATVGSKVITEECRARGGRAGCVGGWVARLVCSWCADRAMLHAQLHILPVVGGELLLLVLDEALWSRPHLRITKASLTERQ